MTSSREITACAASGAALLVALISLLMALLPGAAAVRAAEAPLPPPKPALVSILFEDAEFEIGRTAREQIEKLSAEYARKGGRLEIRAFAGSPHDTSSNARRLALRRALAVRRELIDQGIVAQRIHVKAMGGVADNGPQDRVDISLPGS